MPTARDNRRESPRFRGHGAVVKFRRLRLSPSGSPDVYHDGSVVDYSRGGMCFYSEVELDQGEKIEYFLHAVSGEKEREGVARILHVHVNSGACFVGVKFV